MILQRVQILHCCLLHFSLPFMLNEAENERFLSKAKVRVSLDLVNTQLCDPVSVVMITLG